MRQLVMSSWVLAIGAGCAGAEAMTLAQQPAPTTQTELGLHPGETMAFEVHLAGMLVGEAQLAVGEIGVVDGKKAIVVKSRAATAGAAALIRKMTDEATTLIEADTGRPISVDTLVEMGDKKIVASAKFSGTVANITYTRSGGQPQQSKIDFGTNTLHDAHTAMAQLRGWRATPGTTRSVFVVGGRRLWRVDVKYVGEETIGTALGNRRAVIFDGLSYRAKANLSIESNKAARTFRVWLSDDADRVPLRVAATTELGDVKMELTEYSRR